MDIQPPKVGIGIAIFKDQQILIGKRTNIHGAGAYAVPGGHLEYMESFLECAEREVQEETGVRIKNVRFLCVVNHKENGKHFVGIGLAADWSQGEPKILEPNKCENWDWYDLNNLPDPQFGVLPACIEALKTGRMFFDA